MLIWKSWFTDFRFYLSSPSSCRVDFTTRVCSSKWSLLFQFVISVSLASSFSRTFFYCLNLDFGPHPDKGVFWHTKPDIAYQQLQRKRKRATFYHMGVGCGHKKKKKWFPSCSQFHQYTLSSFNTGNFRSFSRCTLFGTNAPNYSWPNCTKVTHR